jgi:hypothetical protein
MDYETAEGYDIKFYDPEQILNKTNADQQPFASERKSKFTASTNDSFEVLTHLTLRGQTVAPTRRPRSAVPDILKTQEPRSLSKTNA